MTAGESEIMSENTSSNSKTTNNTTTPPTVAPATSPAATANLTNVSWTEAMWDAGWDIGPNGGSVVFQVESGSGILMVLLSSQQPGTGEFAYPGTVYGAGIRPTLWNPSAAWIARSDDSQGLDGSLAMNESFAWPTTPFYLWVSYQTDGTITIGQDRFVGQNVVLQYTDPTPLAGSRYVGLLIAEGGPLSLGNIQTIPTIPVPYQIISENIPAPDPTDDSYLSVTITPSTSAQSFNGEQQTVNQIEISGMHVTTAGTDNVLASLSGQLNIESLTIYADVLEIDQLLTLPQTNVTIYARELIFSGSSAQIVTTPQFVQNTPAATDPGDKGLTGGSVVLNIGQFTAQNGATTAFNLTGAAGQPGGPGITPLVNTMPGTPFDPFYPEGGPSSSGFGGSNVVYYTYSYDDSEDSPPENESQTQGTQAWPGNGGNATPAGVPGDGGDGGALTTAVDIIAQAGSGFIVQPGGASGPQAASTPGGPAGTPNPAYWQIYSYEYHGGCQQGSPNISWSNPSESFGPGADATSPLPANPTGNPGAYTVSGSAAYSWLHPYNLNVALRYIRDAYLNGYLNLAQQTLTAYDQALTAYTSPPADYQVAFSQAAQTIVGLQNRLSANLDYFGNPAGWVPMLSFQSNLAIYQAEVQASIAQLYLAYRINAAATTTQAAANMLATGIAQLQAEISTAMQAFAAADSELPAINAQISNVSTQLGTLQTGLNTLQQQLLQEAQQDVEEEHEALFFVRVLAGIAQLFPIGQPELGAIGSGLDIISNIDTSQPLGTFDQLAQLLQSYQSDNAKGSADNTGQQQNSDDVNNDPENAGSNAGSLIQSSIGLVNGLKTITSGFQELHVSDAEVQARLQEIEASNVLYQYYVEQIKSLNALKTTLETQLNTTLQQLIQANNTINSDLLKVDSMYTQQTLNFSQLNHQAIQFAKDMGQSARDRLAKYQYYLVKSYEYLMLQPFGLANYQLSNVVDAFTGLESNSNSDGTLSSTDYQQLATVYNTILVSMADQILTQYESQSIQSTTKFVVPLTAAQLTQLNTQGQLTLNLLDMNQLDYSWQGVRVTNIATNYIELSDGNSASDSGTGNVVASNVNQVELTFSHGAFSSLRWQGIVYAFNPNSDPNTEAGNTNWGTTFNVQTSGAQRLVPVVPDPATQSMLAQLLKSISGVDTSPLADYQPSATDDITINLTVLPTGQTATVTSLKLEFDFTFLQAPTNEVVLSIQTVGTTNPLIVVNATDLAGNSSGRGSFYRTYPQYQSVQVTAPATFGDFVFSQWVYLTGQVASTSPSIQCLLNSTLQLQCVYVPVSTSSTSHGA